MLQSTRHIQTWLCNRVYMSEVPFFVQRLGVLRSSGAQRSDRPFTEILDRIAYNSLQRTAVYSSFSIAGLLQARPAACSLRPLLALVLQRERDRRLRKRYTPLGAVHVSCQSRSRSYSSAEAKFKSQQSKTQ